jgi:hypothetical protein
MAYFDLLDAGLDGLMFFTRGLWDAGADEVVLWPFPTGDDPADSLSATLDAIQELAAR